MAVTRTGWLKLGALFAVLGGAYAVASWLDLGKLLKPEQVADQLREAGPFGPILFIALMATAVVISPIPSLPLDLAAGATFGVIMGTVYAVIGAEIGAILSFLIGRALGREALTRIFRTEIRFCERCSDRHLAIFIFLSRLIPLFSFDLISYGAGLTNMSLQAFAVATLLGMIVPTYALTYAGSTVISGGWLLIVLGLVMVAVLLLIPKLVLRYPTARWVRLLRGDMPIPTHIHVPPAQPAVPGLAIPSQCDSCGGPLS
ncbi:MAG: TVP38/TMEM64 family protein [Nitrospira sp.]|nr:TVP38/TMEM64 family protein [Nitrospira sp.]